MTNAQNVAFVGVPTVPPKPRVESSNLSAPAKNPPDFARNQEDLLLLVTVRGLLELVCATSRGQIVQSVMPVLNLSVWYSIKIASKFEGVFTALLIMTGELLLLFGIFDYCCELFV